MQSRLNPRGIALFFVLGITIYFNSLWAGFIWDDEALILTNPLIKNFSNVLGVFSSDLSSLHDVFYRPMQNISYMLDFAIYRFDYKGYHLTNILLHIVCAILFYKLTLSLTKKDNLSLFSALLFLVCPLWVESVTYISGRADIIMAIFILSSFILYIRKRDIFSLIFYLCALFSKEASIIYPFILIFYTFLFERFEKKRVYSLSAFFIITVIYLLSKFKMVVNPGIVRYPLEIRILYFIKAIPRYLGLIFFPVNQHMSYTPELAFSFMETDVLLSFSFLILLTSLFLYFLKREKMISFFLGWFLIMLIPYSGIFPINAFFAEHFIYMAAMGIFVIFVYFLQKIQSRLLFNLVFGGYLFFFSCATIKYNFVWQDPARFYGRIIRLSQNSFTAYNNLGAIYLNQDNYDKAEKMLKKCLEINPDYLEARLNLARFYYLKNDYARAIGLAKGVLEKNPKSYIALDYLGNFYFKKGEYGLAEDFYKRAIDLNPNHLPLKADLFSFYESLGRKEEAGKIREEIKEKDKYYLAELDFKEARRLLEENKLDGAFTAIAEATKINVSNSNYYNLKGVILRRKGDYAGAWSNFQEALRVYPRNWESYNNLGNLFALAGDFSRAEENFKKAISLNRDFTDAYFNLGLLYFQQKKFPQAREYFSKTLSLTASHALAKDYLNRLPK